MPNEIEIRQFNVHPDQARGNMELLRTDIRPKVRIYAYQNLVIFDPREPEKWAPTDPSKPKADLSIEEQWTPVGGSCLGSMILGTELTVGVSKEALKLLRQVPRDGRCLGDFDWWECLEGYWALSWVGPLYKILDPKISVTSTITEIPGPDHYQLIDNEVSEEVRVGVDRALRKGEFCWREPYMIER